MIRSLFFRIFVKSLILTSGLIILIWTAEYCLNYMERHQKKNLQNSVVNLSSYKNKIDEIEADPKFQQSIKDHQTLDEAIAVLKDANKNLHTQPSSDISNPTIEKTDFRKADNDENINQSPPENPQMGL